MSRLYLGESVQKIARKKQKSLKALSRELEIPYTTLYSWSLNRTPRNLWALKKLADFADLRVDQLLFGFRDDVVKDTPSNFDNKSKENCCGCFEGRFEVVIKSIGDKK